MLQQGDSIFVYTDGVAEATDAEENLYGIDRTVAALNKATAGSPQTLLEPVHDDLRRFVEDEEQFDDLTMMCVEYFGKPEDN